MTKITLRCSIHSCYLQKAPNLKFSHSEIKPTLSFLNPMMSCEAEMKHHEQRRHRSSGHTWLQWSHLPWRLLVYRCCLSLYCLLTSTPLRTCEMPWNTTSGDVTSACQEPVAQSGASPEMCQQPTATHPRGSLAPWDVKQRRLQQVITEGSEVLLVDYC